MTPVIAYEDRLRSDVRLALREGSMHFEKESAVYQSLLRITNRLKELQIPYAIAGGMALFLHGYRRFTEDIDLLVSREALKQIHDSLEGLGYVPPFQGSKNLRDADSGVRIEFLVTGDYPGDGKPKPVQFPNPETVRTEIDEIQVLSLPKLVELKLASGISSPGRIKDLGDVQELIRLLKLPLDLRFQLDPSVQETYLTLWQGVQDTSIGTEFP
jgi:hypothetical protein